jgi:hypothetical protein
MTLMGSMNVGCRPCRVVAFIFVAAMTSTVFVVVIVVLKERNLDLHVFQVGHDKARGWLNVGLETPLGLHAQSVRSGHPG